MVAGPDGIAVQEISLRTYNRSPFSFDFRSASTSQPCYRALPAATDAVPYPPHKIEKLSDNSYRVTLAVRRFR